MLQNPCCWRLNRLTISGEQETLRLLHRVAEAYFIKSLDRQRRFNGGEMSASRFQLEIGTG